MNTVFSKSSAWAFVLTAAVYLVSLTFISYPYTTLLKPLPIVCLIVGVCLANLPKLVKLLLACALACSLIGDVVLTLPIKLQLEFGIGSFLIAHCFYITLFVRSFCFNSRQLLYFLPILVVMLLIALKLVPVLGDLLIPVMIYILVLMTMVFTSFQVQKERLLLGSGALLFVLSDMTLALSLFLYTNMDARLVIMFTYYAAQFLLTSGLVGLYKSNPLVSTSDNSKTNFIFDAHLSN